MFINSLIWCYSGAGSCRDRCYRKHDVILRYSNTDAWLHNIVRVPYRKTIGRGPSNNYRYHPDGAGVNNWWSDIDNFTSQQRLKVGRIYPTAKPSQLLERIILLSTI